jgi:hypothetical protein
MPPSSSSKQNMGRMSKASAEVMGAVGRREKLREDYKPPLAVQAPSTYRYRETTLFSLLCIHLPVIIRSAGAADIPRFFARSFSLGWWGWWWDDKLGKRREARAEARKGKEKKPSRKSWENHPAAIFIVHVMYCHENATKSIQLDLHCDISLYTRCSFWCSY